jgi:tellurite resistance protein TerC
MLWLWLSFFALVCALLLLHRKISAPTIATPLLWFCIGLAFVGVVYPMYEYGWSGASLNEPSDCPGADASIMFVSAYLMEYALAFVVVLIISRLFRAHRIPRLHQPRVVFWALVGMICVRFIVLSGAVFLVRALTWSFYVFGALTLVSAFHALKGAGPRPTDLREQTLWKRLSRIGRVAIGDHAGAFCVVRQGRRLFTAGGVCVLSIVLSEIGFAFESVTLLSVSTTTFIVIASNILATISQRSWLFVTNLETVEFPRKATTALLLLISAKMFTYKHLHVSLLVWLSVIVGIFCLGVVESVIATRRPLADG